MKLSHICFFSSTLAAAKCLTLRRLTVDGLNGRSPCFAETWIPKQSLIDLSPDIATLAMTQVEITLPDTHLAGHVTVDLTEKATRRNPWLSFNVLSPSYDLSQSADGVGSAARPDPAKPVWRSLEIRMCLKAPTVEVDSHIQVTESRLAGKKRHDNSVRENAFIVFGNPQMPTMRLDEFLMGRRPSMEKVKAKKERKARGLSLKELIGEHSTYPPTDFPFDNTPAATPTPAPTPAVDQSLRANQPCNRSSLYISFSQLQPNDNVVRFPPGLHIFDCVGRCRADDTSTPVASTHAFMMRLVRGRTSSSSSASRRVPLSDGCCIPTDFEEEPINLLVSDRSHGTLWSIFPITNPTVTKCGCT